MQGYEKSSAPRCTTPETGSGRINAPHGTELVSNTAKGIKNAAGMGMGDSAACFKCSAPQRYAEFPELQILPSVFCCILSWSAYVIHI